MIELHLSAREPYLHLLEPYQWALGCQAVSEGLARHEGAAANRDATLASAEDIAITLQLLVLYDRVSISYPAAADDKRLEKWRKKHGIAHINMSAVAQTGLVRLLDPPTELPESLTFRDEWVSMRPILLKYEDFIVSQLRVRHSPIAHWALYRFMIAIRTGEHLVAELVEPAIPPDLRDWAAIIANHNPPSFEVFRDLDKKVLGTARRVDYAFSMALRGEARVGGSPPAFESPATRDEGRATRKVWRVVVSTLLREQIEFPVPTSLKEVLRMRSLPEIGAFREFVGPFVDALVSGDEHGFNHLKPEVISAVRAIKLLPYAKRALKLIAIAGVPVSIIEAFTGAIGPSIAMGVSAVGLEKLARTWQHQSKWLYLAPEICHE